jgi:hypothetical protein
MVTVTQVKLPTRTLNRLQAENNLQRVQKPHDLRGSIPMVDYTNPAKFPPYVFREYPKMPLLDNNRPIIVNQSGDVLIFYDAADEVEFKDMNPDVAEEIDRNTPARAIADTIAAQSQEIEDLRARLRAAGIDADQKQPKNALSGITGAKGPVAAERTETPDAASGEGLAAQVKAAEQAANEPAKPRANPLKNKKN